MMTESKTSVTRPRAQPEVEVGNRVMAHPLEDRNLHESPDLSRGECQAVLHRWHSDSPYWDNRCRRSRLGPANFTIGAAQLVVDSVHDDLTGECKSDLFIFKKCPFHGDSSPVPSEASIGSDGPMAGDNDGKGISG